MSFFQEKDLFITKAFDDIFNCDSDSDEDEVCEITDKPQDNLKKSESEEETIVQSPKPKPIELTIEDDNEEDDGVLVCSPEKRLKSTQEIELIGDSPQPESIESQSSCRRSSRTCVRKKAALQEASRRQAPKRNSSQRRNKQQNNGDVINLSSDEDCDSSLDPNKSSQNRSSIQDQDDYEFKLKITLAGSYRQYTTTYKTKLIDALKSLLDELNENDECLIIQSPLGQTISLMETPYSLNLSPGDILKAIEIPINNNARSKGDNCDTSYNPNEILLKLQDGNRKNTKEFRILKNAPMQRLKERYAKEFNLSSIEHIKFSFDGDVVEDQSTAEELDIEDDCVIDVMITG